MPAAIRASAQFFLFLAGWGLWLVAAQGAEAGLQRFVFEKAEMGVPFRVTLYAADESEAGAASDAAFARAALLNAILSDYDPDSELSRLSRTSGTGRAVPVSESLWKVLERSQEISRLSQGAFDITAGPLVNVWRRARWKRELPSPSLIAEMRVRVGYEKLRLDPAAHTAELRVEEMRLDVGGIAKGFAVDAMLRVLEGRGIRHALVAASGDIAASGAPPGQPGWRIEIARLDAPGAPPARHVWLRHSAVSTSGDTYQRLEVDGVRYSHILDPRTGMGVTDHSLVTVLGPDATTTDSLETTVTVLGPARGLELIAKTPGTAAYIVRQPGATIETHESPNWESLAGSAAP